MNPNFKLAKFSLGGTAAIVTSMGLIAGLNYGANARATIIGGLLVIALADNVSDAFSLHMYKESETADNSEVMIATLGNFFVRLLVTLSFVGIALVIPSNSLVVVESVWGLLLLALLSISISKSKGAPVVKEVILHLSLAVLVIFGSRYLGHMISMRLA